MKDQLTLGRNGSVEPGDSRHGSSPTSTVVDRRPASDRRRWPTRLSLRLARKGSPERRFGIVANGRRVCCGRITGEPGEVPFQFLQSEPDWAASYFRRKRPANLPARLADGLGPESAPADSGGHPIEPAPLPDEPTGPAGGRETPSRFAAGGALRHASSGLPHLGSPRPGAASRTSAVTSEANSREAGRPVKWDTSTGDPQLPANGCVLNLPPNRRPPRLTVRKGTPFSSFPGRALRSRP